VTALREERLRVLHCNKVCYYCNVLARIVEVCKSYRGRSWFSHLSWARGVST